VSIEPVEQDVSDRIKTAFGRPMALVVSPGIGAW
jgi:hypothetical protein